MSPSLTRFFPSHSSVSPLLGHVTRLFMSCVSELLAGLDSDSHTFKIPPENRGDSATKGQFWHRKANSLFTLAL